MNRIGVAVLAACVSGACGGGQTERAPAAAAKDSGAGTVNTAPADNPLCRLFTPADIEKYLGEPVSPGQNAALGTGCQWVATDGTGDVIVAAVPASYHEPPTGAEGYKPLPNVGTRGFVAPELDGWVAGAIVRDDAIRVSVSGGSAAEASAVSLLEETLKRRAS